MGHFCLLTLVTTKSLLLAYQIIHNYFTFLEMKQGLIIFRQNFEISAIVISATSLCSFELEFIYESFLYILYNLCYYAQYQFFRIFVRFWMNLNCGVFRYKDFLLFSPGRNLTDVNKEFTTTQPDKNLSKTYIVYFCFV